MISRRITRVALQLIVFSIVFSVAGCGQSGSDTALTMTPEAELVAFKAAIRAKYDMKEQAFRDNDPEPIINRFYSDRVISTDYQGVTHIGRDELRAVYEEVIGAFVEIESCEKIVKG
ncbi:MAG: hypothetical protein VYC03_05200, partial [Pseudomonadota bacterium]|nr:hypothetical protein [Pseudomonadota bacterium]